MRTKNWAPASAGVSLASLAIVSSTALAGTVTVKVQAALELVGLTGCGGRRPNQLSREMRRMHAQLGITTIVSVNLFSIARGTPVRMAVPAGGMRLIRDG